MLTEDEGILQKDPKDQGRGLVACLYRATQTVCIGCVNCWGWALGL
jgi:hypothetical protein